MDIYILFQVVRWGRSVYANIQKFIQFQLTVNVAALVINVVAAVSSGDVPLNVVEVQTIFILFCAIYSNAAIASSFKKLVVMLHETSAEVWYYV